jgi:hypothetical protein
MAPAALLALLALSLPAAALARDRCTATFIRYVPSPFEQKWVDNIESW